MGYVKEVVKYFIFGQTARSWSIQNHYSYTWVIGLINKGFTDKKIEKLCIKRYKFMTKNDAIVVNYQKRMVKAKTISERLEAKKQFFQSFNNEAVAERVFEELVVGEYELSEEWKPIPGHRGYQVSNQGRFRRIRKMTPYIIKPYPKARYDKHGQKNRIMYEIKISDKTISASRIVAELFVNKPSELHNVIEIINGNPKDIRAENLRWITKHEMATNTGYSPKRSKPVMLKKQDEEKIYRSARSAAKDLNLSYQTVLDYCNGKVKKPVLNLQFCEQ